MVETMPFRSPRQGYERSRLTPMNDETVSQPACAVAGPESHGACLTPLSTPRAYAHCTLASLAVKVFGAATGILAARLLGPEGRGELAVIVFLPTLVAAIGGLSLPQAIAFEVSRAPEREDELAASGVCAGLILGFLEAALLIPLVWVFLPADKLQLAPIAAAFMVYVPVVYAGCCLMGVDQGAGRFREFSIFQPLSGGIYLAGVLLLAAIGKVTPVGCAGAMLAGAFSVPLLRGTTLRLALSRAKVSWPAARTLLRRGLALHLPALAGLALMRSDMLVLVRTVPAAAIGLYAAGLAVAVGHIGTANPFVQVGFRAVAAERDLPRALSILSRHFRMAQVVVLAGGVLTALLAPWLIHLAFGARFAGAIPVAYWLIAATTLWGLAQILDQMLRALEHTMPGMVSNAVGLGLVFAIGVPASLRFGIVGMGAALVVAQGVNLCLLLRYCLSGLQIQADDLCGISPARLAEACGQAWRLVADGAWRGRADVPATG